MSDNPVPFDFVPFSKKEPILKTIDEWESLGDLYTGYIEYEIKTITDVHIVGQQETESSPDGVKIKKSHFNRHSNGCFIPASSVKGMIRSFFEALTNSWVSQETAIFGQKPNERYIGFESFRPVSHTLHSGARIDLGPAIPERLHPKAVDRKLDLASFLFGNVIEESSDAGTCQSRIRFEDILLPDAVLHQAINLPDLPGNAFMGGPKPVVGNWWYFEPYTVDKRVLLKHETAVFLGNEFRGRKFYFHQYPQKALSWYANPKNWPHTSIRDGRTVSVYYTYPVQTIRPESTMENCRVYFERVPKVLLDLFIFTLQPGTRIKHKIGYGKAFGLGSIDIEVKGVHCHSDNDIFLGTAVNYDFQNVVTAISTDSKSPFQKYIKQPALTWMAWILSTENINNLIFTYPPFKPGYFQTPVPWYKWDKLPKGLDDMQIAERLSGLKKTINFRYYQEKSNYWSLITNRKP